jgi:hypothetical protein
VIQRMTAYGNFYLEVNDMWQHEWVSRAGNECYIRAMYTPKRWYLPLGVDVRATTCTYVSLGILCFTVTFTQYRGLSPYTKSCGGGS